MEKKRILALDFDGVICDSAPENAATAWLCCCRLWPERFSGPPPREQVERFCRELRPYMETGYQSIVQTEGLWRGESLERLTTGFGESLAELVERLGVSIPRLKELFGGERDRWLQEDEAGWLGYNRFYPGAAEALRRLLSRCQVRILTTKEERFVLRLMEREGVPFPPEEVFGLGRIRNKETTLEEWSREGEVVFVEDRLATLERVEGVAALKEVRLGFATWGYATGEHRRKAAQDHRLKILHSPEELASLADEP